MSSHPLPEHSYVVLECDLAEFGLVKGDIGVIVHIHDGGVAYMVEFTSLDGQHIAVETLEASQVRAPQRGELACVRAPYPSG